MCILGENYSFSVTAIFVNFLVGGGNFSVSKWEFLVALAPMYWRSRIGLVAWLQGRLPHVRSAFILSVDLFCNFCVDHT